MVVGKNITLRPLQLQDAEFTLQLRRDMEANKALMGYPFPVNMENEIQWLTGLYPQSPRKTVYLAVEENNSRQFAGYLSVKNIDLISGTAEFGIILSAEFRGKGYGSQAMRLFFKYLYQEINLRKISLQVLEDNAPAVAAYEKQGFVREGLLSQHVRQDGRYKNVVLMSLFLERLDFKHLEE